MTKLTDRIRQVLRKGETPHSVEGCSERQLYRTLMMLIHDGDETVRQSACRYLSDIISRMGSAKIENVVRRLLWRLNPESGDYPVGLPELLGEIGSRAPREIKSFVSVILFYLDDEKLQPGLLQAAGRIGEKLPDVLSEYVGEISQFLRNEDPIISANAALALRRIGGADAEEALETLADDTRRITLVCGDISHKLGLYEFAGEDFGYTDTSCFISSAKSV
jgi:hypothetical protein